MLTALVNSFPPRGPAALTFFPERRAISPAGTKSASSVGGFRARPGLLRGALELERAGGDGEFHSQFPRQSQHFEDEVVALDQFPVPVGDPEDFDFEDYAVSRNGRCVAAAPLPVYEIGSIRTGQFRRRADGSYEQTWRGESVR